jgi:hypothetical protein
VWVSPALAYRVATMAPQGRLRGMPGSAFSRIDLIDGVVVATAVHVEQGPAVYDREREEMLRIIRDHTAETE